MMTGRPEGQPSSFLDALNGDSDVVMSETDEEEDLQMEQHALSVWKKMKDSGNRCDCILRTRDGGEIRVHRDIMAASSPYFHALFTNSLDGGDNRKSSVLIPGVTHDMLYLIVHYAYTGEVLVSEENVGQLLPAADQFNMVNMVENCIDYLLNRMTPENCIGLRHFAKQYFLKRLEEESHRFLMAQFTSVAERSEELMDLPIDEAMAIFGAEELNVSNEKVVWEAIVKWIEWDPEFRKHHIVELLRCVRLGLLESNYFMEQVKNNRFVVSNDLCKPVVIETMRFLYDLQDITSRTGEVPTPLLARPRIPNEIMFAIGGWSGGSPTNIMETYDTRADRWIRVNEVDPAGARAYHKCAVIGHYIYVIGGFNGNEYFSSCRRFNVVEKTWKQIAPMTTRRCYVSSSVIGNVIYAMGGYDGHHRQNTAEKYNCQANQWTSVAPMNAQRSDACATTLGPLIYITGGFNGTECLSSCECYDPELNVWREISSMRSRRSGVSCIAHAGFIFALGGFNGISRLQTGEKYNPETDQWTMIPEMFNPRSNFAIEVMDDMIFVVGGFNGVTTIYHVECFDEKNNEWLEATDMNTYRSALAACVVKDLPNIRDFIHQNRENLMEEKRQKLLQMQQVNRDVQPQILPLPQPLQLQALQQGRDDEIDEDEGIEDIEDEESDDDDIDMLQ